LPVARSYTPPTVRALKHESDEKRFADWSHILFDKAVLAEDVQLDEPGVREAAQRADAVAGGNGVEDMDAGELS
jgi:HSP90 family molecular chaperone